MSRPSRAVALAAALGYAGCAFSLEGPKPDRPRDKRPTCDTSKGLVGFDVAIAALSGITAIALLKSDASDAALLPIGVGALYTAGAVSGSHSVDACRVAMAEYDVDVERAHLADVRPPQEPIDVGPPLPRPEAVSTPVPQPDPAPAPVLLPASPLPPPAPKPAPTPARKDDDDDDWSAFWKEVP